MPEYLYKAITKEGVIVKNKVECDNKQNLIKKLKNGDLLPIDIVQVGYGRGRTNGFSRRNGIDIDEVMQNENSSTINQGKTKTKTKVNITLSKRERVTNKDILVFTQDFYLLKKADFNNIHALSTIIDNTENTTFKSILQDVLTGVENGDYIYKTLEYYSDIFPYIYINMIKVGELSDSLVPSLEQAIKYLESNTNTMRKLKGILIPNIIQFVALLVLLFVGCLYTIPTIQSVYEEVGTKDKLPTITIAFSNAIQWIANNWYILVGIIIIIIGAIVWYVRTPKGKYKFDKFKYTMPIFGKLFYSLDFSRLMRAMLLNLQNGMRIQEALDVSKNVVKNNVMRSMIETSINNILDGKSWIDPFEKSGLSSSMVIEMLRVGMQTDLSEMMEKLVEYMEIDIKNIMDNIMAVLPQLIYSIIGVLLIFVVLVILVPCIQFYMGNFLFSAAGL